MAFDALEVAIQLCSALRPIIERVRQHDPDLADQAKRAANGVALQLSEARRRAAKDRLNRYRMAAGSADELHTALRLALAWGYLEQADLGPPLALLDREQALCWRLTH
jgi:four helix bundle protein